MQETTNTASTHTEGDLEALIARAEGLPAMSDEQWLDSIAPTQPKAEECISGCGDPVETRNDKVVGCLHGEDCHSIADGCL